MRGKFAESERSTDCIALRGAIPHVPERPTVCAVALGAHHDPIKTPSSSALARTGMRANRTMIGNTKKEKSPEKSGANYGEHGKNRQHRPESPFSPENSVFCVPQKAASTVPLKEFTAASQIG
jgi:hypothetical protein